MKKADIIVIVTVFLVAVAFYAIYLSETIMGNDLIIEITYKDSLVYATELTEDTNLKVAIRTEEKQLFLEIDEGKTTLKRKPISIASNEEIENTVLITYEEVRMIHANCENKFCFRMLIRNQNIGSPIICTNGVMVKLVANDYSEYDIWA